MVKSAMEYPGSAVSLQAINITGEINNSNGNAVNGAIVTLLGNGRAQGCRQHLRMYRLNAVCRVRR